MNHEEDTTVRTRGVPGADDDGRGRGTVQAAMTKQSTGGHVQVSLFCLFGAVIFFVAALQALIKVGGLMSCDTLRWMRPA